MILQFLQDVHGSHVVQLQHQRVLAGPLELVAVGEDDEEALERHLDGLVVVDAEQVDVVADDVGGAVECEDGLWIAGVRHVGEDVADLPLDVVAVHVEQLQHAVDQRRGADHGLDLGLGAGGDVRQHPARLPPHHFLMVVEHLLEQAQDVMREQLVGVVDAASGDVAEDPNGGNEQPHRGFLEVPDDARDDSAFNNHLYLVLVGVGVVGDGPAAISDDLLVVELALGDHVAQHWDGVLDVLVLGERAASAEVGERPAAVLDERLIAEFLGDFDQVDKSSRADDGVPVEDAVGGDVADGPDGLLNNAHVGGLQQLNKKRDSSLVDDALALDGGARGDVGQRPGGLQLQLRVLELLHIPDHLGDQSGVNNRLDGRVLRDGKDLADADHAVVLVEDVALVDGGYQVGEDVHGVGRAEESR